MEYRDWIMFGNGHSKCLVKNQFSPDWSTKPPGFGIAIMEQVSLSPSRSMLQYRSLNPNVHKKICSHGRCQEYSLAHIHIDSKFNSELRWCCSMTTYTVQAFDHQNSITIDSMFLKLCRPYLVAFLIKHLHLSDVWFSVHLRTDTKKASCV